MTTTYDIAALEALRDRVREATGPDRELDEAICASLGYSVTRHEYTGAVWVSRPGEMRWSPLPRLSASLDACAALQAEVLPGWHWRVSFGRASWEKQYWSHLSVPFGWDRPGPWPEGTSDGDTAPLAWLSAILSALIAMHREAVNV